MNYKRTIFSFWEPKEHMTPYLELCVKTWQRNLPDYEIIFLNYSNIDFYLPEGTFDMTTLKKLPLMMQKDAVMVAVLKEHGGIFMDADTLVTADIAPLVSILKNTEMIMFSAHLAFMAARPCSHILTLWLTEIQRKMNLMKEERNNVPHLQWDFIGNSTLAEVMGTMIEKQGFFHEMQEKVAKYFFLALSTIANDNKFLTPRLKDLMNRIGNSLVYRHRAFYFRKHFRQYLTIMNPREYGFIPEGLYFTSKIMTNEDKYRKFWFDNNIDINKVLRPNQMVIGLHNSYNHPWYNELSAQDVLANEALLSRTLKHLLRV